MEAFNNNNWGAQASYAPAYAAQAHTAALSWADEQLQIPELM